MEAITKGRVKTAAVRAPDFFGAGVQTSILGEPTLGLLAQDKSARVLISADHPHDIVHIGLPVHCGTKRLHPRQSANYAL